MRKVTSILIMFVSVLTMCGQNIEFTYDNARDEIAELKDKQPAIIEQAKASNRITNTDKANADSLLTATFQKLDKVMSVYKQVVSDQQLNHEAQQIIVDFLIAYKSAILDDKKENIKVSTRSFMTVAENSSPKFDEFYNKAQKYIESHPYTSEVEENSDLQDFSDGNNLEESKSNGTISDSLKNGSVLSILAWIALSIGILSLLLSVLALVRINHEHHRINKRKQELEDAERRINQKINELKPSSFRGTAPSYAPPQLPQPQLKPQQRKVQNPVTSVYREDNTQRLKVVERPTISYLYATIKAHSPYAEFFKVTNENSGDKVFMLTLANPESDVAEFTIAPNMSPDFMKSVIIDRDTYLPSLFCEKIIDSSNPTRIEVNSVGRAKKVEGKWQVQERMAIRLV